MFLPPKRMLAFPPKKMFLSHHGMVSSCGPVLQKCAFHTQNVPILIQSLDILTLFQPWTVHRP